MAKQVQSHVATQTAASRANAAFVETCTIIFNAADDDGNGCLDREEFKAVLTSDTLALNLTADEVESVIDEADVDGDGTITLDEFVPVVQKLFYRPQKAKAALPNQEVRSNDVPRNICASDIAQGQPIPCSSSGKPKSKWTV